MARNSLLCADVPLRNYSLTHSVSVITYRSSWWRRVNTALKAEFAIFSICKLLHSLKCLRRLASHHHRCTVLLNPLVPILSVIVTTQQNNAHKYDGNFIIFKTTSSYCSLISCLTYFSNSLQVMSKSSTK